MKTTMIRTLITLGLSAVLSPVALLAQTKIGATIPFDFTVGSKTFAAGDYRVERLKDDVLLIQSVKDGTGVMTLVMPAERSNAPGISTITFNRYGNRYFLAAVTGDERAWRLHTSKVEKELMGKAATPRPVIVAAALHTK